jgi:hypothetical protein
MGSLLCLLEFPALVKVGGPQTEGEEGKNVSSICVVPEEEPDDLVIFDLEEKQQEAVKGRHPKELGVGRQGIRPLARVQEKNPQKDSRSGKQHSACA